MILINLIRKEVLHFFRNKANVITMFIFPIALIVIMGFSLNGLMDVEHNIFENEKVYYKVNNLNYSNKYLQYFNTFKSSCEENMKLNFVEISNDDLAKAEVNNANALAIINIYEDSYSFYRSEKKESQKIFRSVFEQYLDRYAVIDTVLKENSQFAEEISNPVIIKEEGIGTNGISSFTYYTFAELVLIITYISQVTSVSFYNERIENTLSRLKISKASSFNIILSKIILGVIVGIIQIITVYFVSTVFLNITWGENILNTLMVLMSLVIFSSVLGITVSCIFKESKACASVINTLLVVLGFLGGSYIPISLIKSNEIANILCKLTPTYWANISLLSLSSGIDTKYAIISILVSLLIAAILFIVTMVFTTYRVGDYSD